MATSLEAAFADAIEIFNNRSALVRVVLSGRRRNMQTTSERIDIRPVLIKNEIVIQVMENDGRATTTKNYGAGELDFKSLIESGYANILLEHTSGALSIRITKKGEALIHVEKGPREQRLAHDRKKERLLDPADPYLIEVGISDSSGKVKPSRQDKYLQVEEFLRILVPTLNAAIDAGHIKKPNIESPLVIADLGCGNAYLTFATHQYLKSIGIPVQVIGIDIRPQSFKRNSEIAAKLGIEKTLIFKAEAIDKTSIQSSDIAIALHACDTATDDAIAWGVNGGSKILLIAPCCQHDLQTQMTSIPEPWNLLTRHGLMKERLGDLMTDGLRAQILKLLGYRTDVIEFVGGEHTPRNILIRAVLTGAKPEQKDQLIFDQMLDEWKLAPALLERVNFPHK
jgi:hypothetical protein